MASFSCISKECEGNRSSAASVSLTVWEAEPGVRNVSLLDLGLPFSGSSLSDIIRALIVQFACGITRHGFGWRRRRSSCYCSTGRREEEQLLALHVTRGSRCSSATRINTRNSGHSVSPVPDRHSVSLPGKFGNRHIRRTWSQRSIRSHCDPPNSLPILSSEPSWPVLHHRERL